MASSRGRDHSDAHPSDLLYKTTIQEKDSGLGRNSENQKNDTSVANLEKHQQTLSDDIQILSQVEIELPVTPQRNCRHSRRSGRIQNEASRSSVNNQLPAISPGAAVVEPRTIILNSSERRPRRQAREFQVTRYRDIDEKIWSKNSRGQWEEEEDYTWKPAELPKQNAWFPVRSSSPLSTSTTTPSSSSLPINLSISAATGQTSTAASSDLEDDRDELHGASEQQTRRCRLGKHQADGRLESTRCAPETVVLQPEYGSRDGQHEIADGTDRTANEDAMPLENTGASATSLSTPAAEPSHESHANPCVETGPSGPPLRTVTNTSATQTITAQRKHKQSSDFQQDW